MSTFISSFSFCRTWQSVTGYLRNLSRHRYPYHVVLQYFTITKLRPIYTYILGSMIVTSTTNFHRARVGASCNFNPRDVGGVERNVAKGSEVL